MMNYITTLEMKVCFIYELMKSLSYDLNEKDALNERRDLALNLTKNVIRYYHHKSRRIKRSSEEFHEVKKIEKDMKKLLKTISHFTCGKSTDEYFKNTFPKGYFGMLEYFNIEIEKEKE